ncbi:MAG: hypothetical protein ACR2H3_14215 [Acidimicrobiales bacterium]
MPVPQKANASAESPASEQPAGDANAPGEKPPAEQVPSQRPPVQAPVLEPDLPTLIGSRHRLPSASDSGPRQGFRPQAPAARAPEDRDDDKEALGSDDRRWGKITRIFRR